MSVIVFYLQFLADIKLTVIIIEIFAYLSVFHLNNL